MNALAHKVSMVLPEISLHVPGVVAPHCTRDARPWLLEHQQSSALIALDFSSRVRIDQCRFEAKEWHSHSARFGRSDSR